MSDVKANIDIDLSDLKSQLEDITGSMERMFSILGEQKDLVVEHSGKMSDALSGVGHAMQDIGKQTSTESASMLQSFNKVFDFYDDKITELKKKGGFAELVGEMAPQQLAGVQDGLTKLKGSILSELPFGGLAGLMLLGGMRDEEVRAMGAQVSRTFQQAGEVGKEEMNQVGSTVRRLGVYLGKGPTGLGGEIAASAAAFAQAGIDIETVLHEKFERPIKHTNGSILETSFGLDSLFKRAAGTSARQMADMMKDFNLGASQSASVVASIGLAARDSGTSVEAFSSSVMRSAQALRTQRVDIKEVADAQLRFQKIIKDQLMSQGVDKDAAGAWAGQFASQATGQVTQGMSGMSVGLSAVLGERMSARGVGGQGQKTGLGAYYAMKEGFAGEGQTDEKSGVFTESVRELLSLAKENGRTVDEQRFFLEKMGFGFEGSKALMTIGEQAKGPGGLEAALADKENRKALAGSVANREKETSDFQQSLIRIQNGVAKIGSGLLGAVISGFQLTYYAIKTVIAMMSGNDEEKEIAQKMLGIVSKDADRSIKNVVSGIKEAFAGIKMGTTPLIGNVKSEDDIRREVYNKAGKGAKYGGEWMSMDDAKEAKSKNEEMVKSIGRDDFIASLIGAKLNPERQDGRSGITPEMSRGRQLLSAYEHKGGKGADEEIARLKKQGLLEGINVFTGMGESSESMAVREVYKGGRRLEIETITKIKDKGPANSRTAEAP